MLLFNVSNIFSDVHTDSFKAGYLVPMISLKDPAVPLFLDIPSHYRKGTPLDAAKDSTFKRTVPSRPKIHYLFRKCPAYLQFHKQHPPYFPSELALEENMVHGFLIFAA